MSTPNHHTKAREIAQQIASRSMVPMETNDLLEKLSVYFTSCESRDKEAETLRNSIGSNICTNHTDLQRESIEHKCPVCLLRENIELKRSAETLRESLRVAKEVLEDTTGYLRADLLGTREPHAFNEKRNRIRANEKSIAQITAALNPHTDQ